MQHHRRPVQIIFDNLPLEFSKSDVEQLLKRHGRHHPLASCKFIRHHKSQGLIRQINSTTFTKTTI